MEFNTVSVVVFWGPLLVLGAALLLAGRHRDRGRPVRAVLAVAALSALLVAATTVAVGWNGYQQQAERDACLPLTDC